MTSKSIVFPKLAGWGMLAVSVLALLLLPGIKSRALAQNTAASKASSQNKNSAQPQLAMVLQTADESSKAESRAPEGNRNSQTSASTPQAPSAQENSIPPYYRKWLEEDVAYIISEPERSTFKKLANDEDRDAFIEQFWARRNPEPRSSGNSFKEEHYRRIAYVNEHFSWRIPGWKTDRGRIYIMYGKPDEESGGTIYTYPFEKWWYRHIDGVGDDIEFEFVDSSNSGEYRMAMSPAEKDTLINVPNASPTYAAQTNFAQNPYRSYASSEPNLSGTWILDQINRQGASGPVTFFPFKQLRSRITISQKGNELLIEPHYAQYPNKQIKYVVDGTERKLLQIGAPDPTYYIARWEGDSLIIDKESDHLFPNGRKWTSHNREVWSISADGNSLTYLYVFLDKTLTGVFKKGDIQ